MSKLSFYKCTGTGYENGWWTNCKCRYRIYKGARNTKKSYNMIGLEVLNKIITDSRRNILIIRETLNTHRMSTFSTLCMLIDRPDMMNDDISFNSFFKINKQDMTISYRPTGQLILFRGFDDPQKLQSIRVPKGYLTDVYVEEAFEIDDYEEWRKFDGSIRGKLPQGCFHQITLCFNAWNKDHWLYEHFFKDRLEDDIDYLMEHTYADYYDPNLIIDYGKGLYLHISTYKINDFRDKAIYDVAMEELKKVAPEIFKVEALGMWGNASASTYPEFNDSLIITPQQVMNKRYSCFALGIDTGLSNGEGKIKYSKDLRLRSATSMQMTALTADYNELVCVKEFFYSNEREIVKKTEPQLMQDIITTLIKWRELYKTHPDLMKGIVMVYVDSADIGFRQGLEVEAMRQGLINVKFMPATKQTIQNRVDFVRLIMAYGEYKVSSECPNLIREIRNSRQGEKGQPREDFDNHALDSHEYSWASFINKLKRWNTYKQR